MEKKIANFCTEGISMRSVTDLSKFSKTNLETKVRWYDIYWALQNCSVEVKKPVFWLLGKLNCLYKYLQTNKYTSLCRRIKPVVSVMQGSRYLLSRPWSPGYCKIHSFHTCDIASETVRNPFDHSRYKGCPGLQKLYIRWCLYYHYANYNMALILDKVMHISGARQM